MKRWRIGVVATFILLAAVAVWRIIGSLNGPHPSEHGEHLDLAGKLVVRSIDVGQGDATLITTPHGKNILIDAGPRDGGVVAYLKNLELRIIDVAIATHPHSDHIGSMRTVLQQFSVNEFWDSGFPHPTATYEKMLDELERERVFLREPKRDFDTTIDDVAIHIFWPSSRELDENPNNGSIVTSIRYGNLSFLFPGDAELDAWDEMLNDSKLSHVDVLKLAHHGSSNGTSPKVLNRLTPSTVIISCAKANPFHHPHPGLMRVLSEKFPRSEILRTDLMGTITMATNGNNIEWESERSLPEGMKYADGDHVASGTQVVSGSDDVLKDEQRFAKKRRRHAWTPY